MSGRLAIGVGCRRGATAASIVALVERTLAGQVGLAKQMFTIEEKAGEDNLRDAARALGLDLVGLSAATLRGEAQRLRNPSPAAQKRFGVPNVAEAAALAGAGEASRLVAIQRSADAVCALALSAPP